MVVNSFIFLGDLIDAYNHGMKAFFSGSKKMSKRMSDVSSTASFVAVLKWKGRELDGITLQPIKLSSRSGRPIRPMLTDKLRSQNVINSLKNLSEPFGTTISWDEQNQVGHISMH